jgi:hypothetical protein
VANSKAQLGPLRPRSLGRWARLSCLFMRPFSRNKSLGNSWMVDPNSALPTAAPAHDKVETESHKAIVAMCDLLGLLLALPFGDRLYHGDPITFWHWTYAVIGIGCVGVGHMWPKIKSRAPSFVSRTLPLAAQDVRAWILIILMSFAYLFGPDVYRRAASPTPAQSASDAARIAELQGQVDTLKRELDAMRQHPAPQPSWPVTSTAQWLINLSINRRAN